MTTLVLVLKKSNDKTKYDTFYSQSTAETIVNEHEFGDIFQSIYTKIVSNIRKFLGKGLGWFIDSVIEHKINIAKCNKIT